MKTIRITHPKGLLIGSTFHPAGDVIAVQDDRRAAQLVALGHAEHVVLVPAAKPGIGPLETATAPQPPRRAVTR